MGIPLKNTNQNKSREGWILLGIAALIVLFYFFKLYYTLGPQLEKTEQALLEHRAVKLEGVVDRDALKKIIADGNYYSDQRDINLLADSLASKLLSGAAPDNLGALNKSAYAIHAPLAWKSPIGGTDFEDRLRASRQRLGFDSALYVQELKKPAEYPAETKLAAGDVSMKGRVLNQGRPMAGVLVELRQHIGFDPVDDSSITEPVTY